MSLWPALRQRLPWRWKIAFPLVRAGVLDPFGRGIEVTIGGQRVRVPAYFRGGVLPIMKPRPSAVLSGGSHPILTPRSSMPVARSAPMD